MDREVVELLCRSAASLQRIREAVRKDPVVYLEVKDYIFDILEGMAIYCDTAPIRLVEGQVDEIMRNLGCPEKLKAEGV